MKAAHWGVVALGSIAGVAMMAMPAAADGGRGPPPPPYEQGYYPSIWQGLYAGVNAGVGWAGDASGAVGGGQVGYNWRSQQFVYGIEGDISASNIGVDANASVCSGGFCSRIDAGASIDWFSTIRGRAGILVQPNLLVYATAGVATVHTEAHVRDSLGNSISISETNSGFVGGVGVESKINETMSWRVEYLNFGHPADFVRDDTGIVRAGLNFRFGN